MRAVPFESGREFESRPYFLDAAAAHAYGAAVEHPARRAVQPNIHDDDAAARRAGFRAPIAAGEHTYALAANFMVDLFGIDFLRGGHLEASMIKPVFFGDRLVVHARVTAADDSEVAMETWVENDRKERVLVGSARLARNPR
ncbi:MAG TPA: MaoC family dehydratase [Candidatus Binataceae bacterium]|nr:MaoC family dehydratase [Candidatus Binataceae bacterium]